MPGPKPGVSVTMTNVVSRVQQTRDHLEIPLRESPAIPPPSPEAYRGWLACSARHARNRCLRIDGLNPAYRLLTIAVFRFSV